MLLAGALGAIAAASPAVNIGDPTDDLGRPLRLGDDGDGAATRTRMRIEAAPARIVAVASVPGRQGDDAEAWAVGRTDVRRPGYDTTTVGEPPPRIDTGGVWGGQEVLLHYTSRTGWRVTGLPLDADGEPVRAPRAANDPGFTTMAVTANGDGWAFRVAVMSPPRGEIYRKDGDTWRYDAQASAIVATKQTVRFSLVERDGGTVGYLLGRDGTGPQVVAHLDPATGWREEPAPPPPGGGTSDYAAIAAADADHVYLVGGAASQLVVMRRAADGTWERVTTGRDRYDHAVGDENVPDPATGLASGITLSTDASSVSSVAAVANGDGDVWITGQLVRQDLARLQFHSPADTGPVPQTAVYNLFGSDGDDIEASQPFVLRLRRVGGDGNATVTVHDACPPVLRVLEQGQATAFEVCDEDLPVDNNAGVARNLFTFGAPASGDALLITGNTFVRHTQRGWEPEPRVVTTAATATFATPDEGWLVTRHGNTHGGSAAVAHWSTTPLPADRLRRWAQPALDPFTAVAEAPTGEPRRAVAVGAHGTIALLEPGVGWDTVTSGTTSAFRAVAWPAPGVAWAVGDDGTVARIDIAGRKVELVSGLTSGGSPLTARLNGIAFRSPTDGWAVGAHGTVLHGDGHAWTASTAGGAGLNAIAVAGRDVVAVGDDATVLVHGPGDGGGWLAQGGLAHELSAGDAACTSTVGACIAPNTPDLLAVVGLPDGRAYAAGTTSVLLTRVGEGGAFHVDDHLPPLEGNVHTLAVMPTDDGDDDVRLVASVSAWPTHDGDRLAESDGWPLVLDGGAWRPLVNRAKSQFSSDDVESPIARDGVFGITVDPSDPSRGWMVGGHATGADDDRPDATGATSSSIWRFDLAPGESPERSPSDAEPVPLVPKGAIGFAFVGDTACGQGMCSANLGLGSRADVLLTAALRDVRSLVASGDVRFVVSSGNRRRQGLPGELAPVDRLLDDVGVPWFAALGSKDALYQRVFVKKVDDSGNQDVKEVAPPVRSARSVDFALQDASGRPAPWGRGRPVDGFAPVDVASSAGPVDSATVTEKKDIARTHYAFDYAPVKGSPPVVRVVVLDSSVLPLSNAATRNPSEQQLPWLTSAVADARSRQLPIVVVTHRPLVAGLDEEKAAAEDDATFSGPLLTADAVLAGHQARTQMLEQVAGRGIPVVVAGALGSLADRPLPEQGGYPAWFLVTVDAGGAIGPVGRVRARPVPVLESVALTAPDGRAVDQGGTLRFGAVGRQPDTGTAGETRGTGSDARHQLRFPFPPLCLPGQQASTGACRDLNVAVPDGSFSSDDPSIGDFVTESPLFPGTPLTGLDGKPVRDPTSGLFCSFRPGSTTVRFQSGMRAAKLPVTVTGPVGGVCAPRQEGAPAVTTTVPEAATTTVRVASPPRTPAPPAVQPPSVPVPAKAPATRPVRGPVSPPLVEPLPVPVPVVEAAVEHHPTSKPVVVPQAFPPVAGVAPPAGNLQPAPPGGMGSGVPQSALARREEEALEPSIATSEMQMTAWEAQAVAWSAAVGLTAIAALGRRRRAIRAAAPPLFRPPAPRRNGSP
jgi:hypothetical protein